MGLETNFKKLLENQEAINNKPKYTEQHMELLKHIPLGIDKAIKQPELRSRMGGISARKLKVMIVHLREDYPICSKETQGGGYWIAKTGDEVQDFINMIERRKKGYDDTIKTMNKLKERLF